MSVIKVPTNFNIDLEFEIPEFYRRLLALMIDFLILFFYYKISKEIIISIRDDMDPTIENAYNIHWLGIVIQMTPLLLYFIVFEIAMNGQTIGKRILGLRVVDEHGGKASISQFVIRWLVRDIWFVIIFLISKDQIRQGKNFEPTFLVIFVLSYFITDIVLVVMSKKAQRIGDLLAKTIIIRTNPKGDIEETVFREVADDYVPAFPQIMRLSDKDINAIKSILETARKKNDFYMAEAASAKIKAHLRIESSMDAFDFLDVLLKDYNYLSTR